MKSVIAVSVAVLFFGLMALSDSHGKECGHAHGVEKECSLMESSKEACREECAKKECDLTVIGNKMICPVMGNTFQITRDTPKTEYEGKIYFFCCSGCIQPFESEPEKYISEKE